MSSRKRETQTDPHGGEGRNSRPTLAHTCPISNMAVTWPRDTHIPFIAASHSGRKMEKSSMFYDVLRASLRPNGNTRFLGAHLMSQRKLGTIV